MTKIIKLTKICAMIVFICNNLAAKEYRTHNFSIIVPDNWVQIPSQVLKNYSNDANNKVHRLKISRFNYGFQKDYHKDFIKYPNMLIKIKNKGKLSKQEFKSWANRSLQNELNKNQNELNKNQRELNKLTNNQIIKPMVFDEKYNLIWFETSFNDSENDIQALSFMLQTEKGIIQLYGNCLKKDYQKCKPLFLQIAKSVQLSKELQYEDSILKKKSTYVLIFSFLIIYIIILVAMKALKARNKRDET